MILLIIFLCDFAPQRERGGAVTGAEDLLSTGRNIHVSWNRDKEHSGSPGWKEPLAQTRAQKDAQEGERGQTSGTALENVKLCEIEQGAGQQGKREQGLELHAIISPTTFPHFRKGFAWLRVRKSYL